MHHRIPELIEDLLLQLLTSRPAHPLAFLCNALAKRHALTEGHDASHDGQQFSFVQVADVQLGFIDNPACDPAKPLPPGSTWSELAMVDALVQQVNALDPAFVVACGDHTHAEPTQEAHSELYRKQVRPPHLHTAHNTLRVVRRAGTAHTAPYTQRHKDTRTQRHTWFS